MKFHETTMAMSGSTYGTSSVEMCTLLFWGNPSCQHPGGGE